MCCARYGKVLVRQSSCFHVSSREYEIVDEEVTKGCEIDSSKESLAAEMHVC